MPPDAGLFVQLGVAGTVLYLFLTDKLRTKGAFDEATKAAREGLARVTALYEARIRDGDARTAELRRDRDEWKKLALGTEARLDLALPPVAAALGAPVPSVPEGTPPA